MDLLLIVFSGFALAPAAPWLLRPARGRPGRLIFVLLPLVLTLHLGAHILRVARGETFRFALSWAPALGLELSFRLDGLGLLFALMIAGIGTLIFLFAGSYLAGHPQEGRLFAYLLMFMASMLGLVLADNLIALFVFWELTSLSSYFLIGFDHRSGAARSSALQALLVTAAGGLALLAGMVLLGGAGGSFSLAALAEEGDRVRSHPLYTPIVLLVLAGAFTKSAQFPFHFWLPGAMVAPTPVSAYLHSATMVKAGIYIVARLSPTLGGTEEWSSLVAGGGAVTMLLGGALAILQTDLKLILAYSTVSALGTIMMCLGLGTPDGFQGAMVFLFAHGLYKGALFMVAGAVDHETGTRDIRRIGGLRRRMPVTAAAAVAAAISLAGFGPVLSFIGKEAILEALLDAPRQRTFLLASMILASALFVAVAGLTAIRPFFGREKFLDREPHEAPPGLWSGPALLAGLGIVLGLAPGAAEHIIGPAASAILGRPEPVDFALWHGFGAALGLSAASVVAGMILVLRWTSLHRASGAFGAALSWGPERWYAALLAGTNALARAQTRIFQSGYLRVYILIILLTAIGLVGAAFSFYHDPEWGANEPRPRFYEVVLAALILLSALAAVRARSRLASVAALGFVGYGMASIFMLFGAPDLAMTQMMIETLTVVLLVLVLYHLPSFKALSPPRARIRDAAVAGLAGLLMAAFVLSVTSIDSPRLLSDFYAEKSLPDAHGRNIVNVILVDFRGLDTLGEITVLAAAGLGVHALLKLRPSGKKG